MPNQYPLRNRGRSFLAPSPYSNTYILHSSLPCRPPAVNQDVRPIVRPDGTSTDSQMYSVIDDWGRSIKFWIDGIASDHRLIATTIEGESWQLLVYDLNEPDNAPSVYYLSKSFLPKLSSACRESLGVVGLTRAGDPVIAGNDLAWREVRRRLWKVEQGAAEQHARAVPLPEHYIIMMLAPRRPPSL